MLNSLLWKNWLSGVRDNFTSRFMSFLFSILGPDIIFKGFSTYFRPLLLDSVIIITQGCVVPRFSHNFDLSLIWSTYVRFSFEII